ncbi:MAG TPA: hypothetical protein VF624_09360 [Tepidisphaeraceae bacterium]|jgi:hypothetical protein
MRDGNVLQFPIVTLDSSGTKRTPSVKQLDLFTSDHEKVSAITFFGLDGIDQNVLLASFIRHDIKTIIDLRSKPVFPKPFFDHKYLMNYFYLRSVDYIECSMSRSPSFERRPLGRPGDCDRFEQWIATDISTGITACIIDAAAIEHGAVASFRHCIATASKCMIEIHPRSLL